MTSINWDEIADLYLKCLDKTHVGTIDKAELTEFFNFAAKNGYQFNPEHLDAAFKHADTKGDGKLTKAELVDFLKNFN